jgi:hypothetical protein
MGTVASQLTRISDVEGSLSLTSIGGGPGGSANTDIFIQGDQSAARRQSNATDHGFFLGVSSIDVSGATAHVGAWINHVHYGVLTKLAVRLGSSTTAYHEHHFPLASYPQVGGWIRVWISVARTPEGSAGTFDKSALTQVGLLASLPSVGGTSQNLILDAIDSGVAGLVLTGTDGLFADFLAADEGNSTNKHGVITSANGVLFCLARLTLGSASSLAMDDSGFVLIFPDQSLVSSEFMGLSVDLQHASTDIALRDSVIRSAGTVRGDLLVSGASGSFLVDGCAIGNLRTLVLTSACTISGSSIAGCGVVVAGGASLERSSISGSTAAAAVLWDSNHNTDGRLDGVVFTSSGAGHALELGPDCPTEISLRNVAFTGYGADGTANAALRNDSGKTITINLLNTPEPTVINVGDSNTIFVADPLILTIESNVSLIGAEVRIYDMENDPVGSLGPELAGTEIHDAATFSAVIASANLVWIQIMHDGYVEFGQEFTMPSTSITFTALLVPDQNA